MEWWIGGDWPGNMVDTVLKQSICLTINKKGLTLEQIAKRVDANETYVREALDALEAEELVEKVGRGRYRNTFIALDAADRTKCNQEIRPLSERAADVLEEGLPELQAAWENSLKPAQGFDWSTGIWLTTAIMICQCGLPRNGQSPPFPEPPLRPVSGKRYWLGGEEAVAPEQALWSFSLCFHGHQPLFSYGFLWSEGLGFNRRPWFSGHDASFSKERLLLLAAVASGSTDIDSAAKVAELDMEKAREAAADAIELGWLERQGDRFALTFPVFTNEDESALLPAVDRVSAWLAEILDPTMPLIDGKLSEFGFDHWKEQFPLWHSKPRYGAAAEGIRVLYKRGLLSFPGDPAPANFCMWGDYGETQLFTSSK